jgi:DNA invertase Pin-like site-specific DNA recombinase
MLPLDTESDLIADVVQEIARAWPNLPAAEIHALARTLRARWGGCRPYIKKDRSQDIAKRTLAIRAARLQGQSVATIAAANGCTRSQVERALGWK